MKEIPTEIIHKPPAVAKALAGKPTSAQLNDLIKEVEKEAGVEILDVSPWMEDTFIPGLIRKVLLGENVQELLNSSRIGNEPNTQIPQKDAEVIIKTAQKYKKKLAELTKPVSVNIPIPKAVPEKTRRGKPVPKSEVPGTPSVLPYEVKVKEGQPVKKEVLKTPPIAAAPAKIPKEMRDILDEIKKMKEDKKTIHEYIEKAEAEKNEGVLKQLTESLKELNRKLTPKYIKLQKLREKSA